MTYFSKIDIYLMPSGYGIKLSLQKKMRQTKNKFYRLFLQGIEYNRFFHFVLYQQHTKSAERIMLITKYRMKKKEYPH